jgi:hypothetical protein
MILNKLEISQPGSRAIAVTQDRKRTANRRAALDIERQGLEAHRKPETLSGQAKQNPLAGTCGGGKLQTKSSRGRQKENQRRTLSSRREPGAGAIGCAETKVRP